MMMATKEPLRRCVRCKTKKKGCSRGSPCERCALAGLTADECIYLESDSTYRNIKPKRKDASSYTPKPVTNKVVKALSSSSASHAQESGAIVRCSRCIRTARGCSHERPCQPCRENGLSEWECRYTSASSFKVRGPGARAIRKVKSMDKMTAVVDDDDEDDNDLVAGDANETVRRILKQERSHSTNSAPTARARLLIDRMPLDYRTPSPPTNISPISEPPNWREGRHSTDSPTDDRTNARARDASVVFIPVTKISDEDGRTIAETMSGTNGGTHLAAGSVEPPPMMTLIPSISQQSHATIPESSPAIYTDDYQSSPSPYNSPQFQSSPPIHFHSIAGMQGGSLPDETGLFAHQVPYRPPAGFTVPGHVRQHAVSQHSQVGFAIPHQSLAAQQQQQYLQHQHNLLLQQQYAMYATSPPRQQHQQQQQQQQQQMPSQFATTSNSSFAQIPRQRTVPSPAPRYGSPHRRPIYEHRVQSQSQVSQQQQYQQQQQQQQPQTQMVQAYPQAIPGRSMNAHQRYAAQAMYGMSPTDGHLQSPEGSYQEKHKPNALSMLRHTSHQSHGSQGRTSGDVDDFDDPDLTWHDAELVFSAE